MNSTTWLILGCVAYSFVIVVTFYFFLAFPLRRRTEVEAAQLRTRPELHESPNVEISALLDRAEHELTSKISLTLGKVAAGLQLIRYASRRMIEIFDSKSLREFSIHMRGVDIQNTGAIALDFIAELRKIDAAEVGRLEIEFSLQRRTSWLSLAGLLLVIMTALIQTNHSVNIALGALGGFVAVVRPFVLRRPTDSDYVTSWNVIILSPVAGALAAVPGLLLVALLASNGLLGEQFAAVWSHPESPTALGISVVVGLIGGLIGVLAKSASTILDSNGIDT